MPIYEYGCPKCGEFELRQSVNDPVLTRCPTCRSKVTKLISSPAFQLKGGGWYSDGYQKKAASSGTSGGGTGGSGGDGGAGGGGSGSAGGSNSGSSD